MSRYATSVLSTCSHGVPSREGSNRGPQKRSRSSCRHSSMLSQHAPHWRGCSSRNSLSRTPSASTSSTGIEPAGNKATWRRVPSSCTSMVLRHASRWLALISPRYSTWRCTTRPSLRRRFSTTFQYSWLLPSFTRRVQRKNMRPLYKLPPPVATSKVFTTSVLRNRPFMNQSLARAKQADSHESNGELRKMG